MNQKYLMGMAAEGGQAVVFEAKASNVAAFISQNRMAPELLICTLDYKMFLTARRGMIDMCPDRKFLVQELLPVLVPMQTGQVQDMPLVLVPRESVQDEECPQPDWNVPFPVSWTVKMKKKQKETQDILSYHSQAAGCSDKARAKASGGRQPIEECGRTGL